MTYRGDLCHFRDLHECLCPAGECLAQPKPAPPIIAFSWKDHAAACVVFGAIAAFIAFVSIPMAREASKQIHLAEQEIR